MLDEFLFDNPSYQYDEYSIIPLFELNDRIGPPEAHEDGNATEDQIAAMAGALKDHPEFAITYDYEEETWIMGEEADLAAMFDDREEFEIALQLGEVDEDDYEDEDEEWEDEEGEVAPGKAEEA